MFLLCYARTVLRTNFHFSNHVLAFIHHHITLIQYVMVSFAFSFKILSLELLSAVTVS